MQNNIDEANKANLWDLRIAINNDDIKRAKNRIKEYGYVAEPWFIVKMLNYINE